MWSEWDPSKRRNNVVQSLSYVSFQKCSPIANRNIKSNYISPLSFLKAIKGNPMQVNSSHPSFTSLTILNCYGVFLALNTAEKLPHTHTLIIQINFVSFPARKNPCSLEKREGTELVSWHKKGVCEHTHLFVCFIMWE